MKKQFESGCEMCVVGGGIVHPTRFNLIIVFFSFS